MMWLKACRRCHGDLVESIDFDGPVIQCLQCGRSAARPHQAATRNASGRRPPARGFTLGDLGPMVAGGPPAGDTWVH